ncbi:thioredoxin-like protein [Syncephalis fuscata]|nr:thioredoxin-like protein [Syncephalis fuscata]
MRRSATTMLFSLLAFCLTGLTVALPLSGAEDSLSVPLGEKNFTETVSAGLWFVKHYSPKCKHCKKMAPIWVELSHKYSETKNFHLAEINCIAEADLCERHDITGFPTMVMYNNGDREEEYVQEPTLELMSTFVEDQLLKHIKKETESKPPATKETAPKPKEDKLPPKETTPKTDKSTKQKDHQDQSTDGVLANPNGHAIALSSASFEEMVNGNNGAWFLKFYAPWCGYCQQLAPTWVELGQVLKGKVNVGSVDCTVEKGDVVDGVSSEYIGARTLDALKAFAMKAAGAQITKIEAKEWPEVSKQNEVMIIMVDPETKSAAMDTYSNVARSLFAVASYYHTTDTALAKQLNVKTTSGLVVYKDERAIPYTGSLTDKLAIREFIEEHRYPALIPINAGNAKRILGSGFNENSWVVLGLFAPKRTGFERVKNELKTAAISHMYSDSDKKASEYESYVSTTFNINDGNLPSMVIINHKEEEYFDKDADNDKIASYLEAAQSHKLQVSKEYVGRICWTLKGGVKKLTRAGSAAINNPFLAFIGIVGVFGVLAYMVKRSTGESTYSRVDLKPIKLDYSYTSI